MKSVFGVLHHFCMRLQPDKNSKKSATKKLSVFTAGSITYDLSNISGHGFNK